MAKFEYVTRRTWLVFPVALAPLKPISKYDTPLRHSIILDSSLVFTIKLYVRCKSSFTHSIVDYNVLHS